MADVSDDPFIAWWEAHRPIGTPVGAEGPMVGDTPRLFGWSPKDWEFVSQAAEANPLTVWTVLDCDGAQFVSAGLHYVNRLGYFVTEVPAANGDIEIRVGDDDPDEDFDDGWDEPGPDAEGPNAPEPDPTPAPRTTPRF